MVRTTRKCNSVYSQRAEDRLARDLKVDPIELNIAQTASGRACETVGISRGQVVYIYASRVS